MEKTLKNKNIYLTILKYTGMFVLFYFLSLASVNGSIVPFYFGLYIALAITKNDAVFLGIPFAAGGILANFSVQSVIIYFVIVLVTYLVQLIHKRHSKKVLYSVVWLYVLICNIPSFYFNFRVSTDFVNTIISVCLGIIFMYACFHFINAFLKKGYTFNFSTDESVCGALILLGLFNGLACFNFVNFNFALLFGVVFILFLTYIAPRHISLMLSVVIGFGITLAYGQFVYVGLFAAMATFSLIFKTNIKVCSCIAITLVDLLFGLYFNAFLIYDVLHVIAVAVPSALFILVPDNLLKDLSIKCLGEASSFTTKHIINQNQEVISRKLMNISEVFFEMDKVFRNLVKGNLAPDDAKKMILAETIQNLCDNCQEKNRCLRMLGNEMQTVFTDLINIGFEKGKVTLLDIPQFLTNRCIKVNQLVSTINALLAQYKQYSKMVSNLDSSRVLIAEQLFGMSKVLKNLSNDINSSLTFDSSAEKQIAEELIYYNVVTNDITVYEQDKKTSAVSLVIKNSDVENKGIVKTINKVCNQNMIIESIAPCTVSGLSIINFVTAPKYQLAFGLSQVYKNNADIGGDTHSVIKLNNDKYLCAVCDGMGSGEKAHNSSNLAISLIENFYKAGFDNDTILTSVNKLLNLGREDVFSALDVCVIDLKDAVCDFVKVGGVNGYIKHSDTITVVESGALPLGILEEIVPKISKTSLAENDMVVIVSDGISDAFLESENLSNFINNYNTQSPQELSEGILTKAKELNKGMPNDDMTVLVFKIYARN